MKTGLEQLRQIREYIKTVHLADKSKCFNTARVEFFELDNLIEVAVSTAKTAVFRTESRGAHSREDYKTRDDINWHCHSIDKIDQDPLKRPVDMKPEIVEPIPLKEREQ